MSSPGAEPNEPASDLIRPGQRPNWDPFCFVWKETPPEAVTYNGLVGPGGIIAMTMKRTGPGWMPADDYGCALPNFTVNLLVRDLERSLPFYRDVLRATVHYADEDFAALELQGTPFMLHADHAYDHHPYSPRLGVSGLRGTGVELRALGVDPDAAESRARAANALVLQPARDFPHGWRDVMLVDPDGYVWALGIPIGGQAPAPA